MDYDIAKMTASSIRAHKIQKVKCFNCFKTGHTSQQCQMQKVILTLFLKFTFDVSFFSKAC